MRLNFDALVKRLSILALSGLILAGCEEIHYGLPIIGDEQEDEQPAPQEAPMVKEPLVILSQGWVLGDEAQELLQGDTIALRFLVLKQLAESGAVPPQAVLPRIAANKGALLPLTKALGPSVGLDRQIPSMSQIKGVLQGLPMDSAAVTVILDGILPQTPKARQKLAPQTKVAARSVLDRLARLESVGLITRAERIAEAEAVAQLILGDTIPETDIVPPPPPPPPAAAPASKGKGGAAHRSLESMFIPDPGNFSAPKLDDKASGPAGLYLMQIPDPSQADKAWNMLKTQSPELATMGMVLVRTDLGDVGVTWRLVAGPVTADEARKLCEGIRPKKQDCTPIPFPKNGVQPPAPKVAPPAAAAPTKAPEAAPEK